MSRVDPRTAIGAVHLTIADLDRSVDFYQTRLGMTVHAREAATARLGAGAHDLLVLTEARRAVCAPPLPPGAIGLRRFVVRVPDRASVAKMEQRLHEAGTPVESTARGIEAHDPSMSVVAIETDV